MEILNYFILTIVAYLGLVAGYVFLIMAPEEKKPGMRYFRIVNHFLFILSILLLIWFKTTNVIFWLSVVVLLVLYFALRRYHIYVAYIMYSLMFYFFEETEIKIFAVIIFAYGLSAGAYICEPNKRGESLSKIFILSYFILVANTLKLVL